MSVQTLLDNYFLKEDKNLEKRFCKVCKKNMNLEMSRKFEYLGAYAMIHLKRFYGNGTDETFKNHIQIDVDLELDIIYKNQNTIP